MHDKTHTQVLIDLVGEARFNRTKHIWERAVMLNVASGLSHEAAVKKVREKLERNNVSPRVVFLAFQEHFGAENSNSYNRGGLSS